MDALVTLAIYVVPFLVLAVIARMWLNRRSVALSDAQAEADPNRAKRPVFLLGLWRDGKD
ncbi:MAG TPA: hypothetical protein VHU15_17665 [Stellaceae bacterium]|jgi:hypothetical protein|nr:hypothetical protein [Stellaceae bacterium]